MLLLGITCAVVLVVIVVMTLKSNGGSSTNSINLTSTGSSTNHEVPSEDESIPRDFGKAVERFGYTVKQDFAAHGYPDTKAVQVFVLDIVPTIATIANADQGVTRADAGWALSIMKRIWPSKFPSNAYVNGLFMNFMNDTVVTDEMRFMTLRGLHRHDKENGTHQAEEYAALLRTFINHTCDAFHSQAEGSRRVADTLITLVGEITGAGKVAESPDGQSNGIIKNEAGSPREASTSSVDAETESDGDEDPVEMQLETLGRRFAEFTADTGHTVWMRFLPKEVDFDKPETCLMMDIAVVWRTLCADQTLMAAMNFAKLAREIPGLEALGEELGFMKCNELLEEYGKAIQGKLCWMPVSLMAMADCDKAIGAKKTEEFAKLWLDFAETAHFHSKILTQSPTSKQYLDKVLDGYRSVLGRYLPSQTCDETASARVRRVQSVPLEEAIECMDAWTKELEAQLQRIESRVAANDYADPAEMERDLKENYETMALDISDASNALTERLLREAPNGDSTLREEMLQLKGKLENCAARRTTA